jgi:hypothetical protein
MVHQQGPNYFVTPGLSFSSGSSSLEEPDAGLYSSSYGSLLVDATPGAVCRQSSPTQASSTNDAQLSTNRTAPTCCKKRRLDQPLQISSGEHFASQLSRYPTSADSLDRLVPTGDYSLIPTSTVFNQNPPFLENAQLMDLEHSCAIAAEVVKTAKPTSGDCLLLSVELKRLRHRLNNLQSNRSGGFDSSSGVSSLPEHLTPQLQVLVTRIKKMLNSEPALSERREAFDDESELQQRLWQVNARRLVRSIYATFASFQILNNLSSTTTGSVRVLTSHYNKQLLVLTDQRHPRNMHPTVTSPQEDLTVLPVLDFSMTNGLAIRLVDGPNVQNTGHEDCPNQHNRANQLTIIGRVLPAVILASVIAVSVSTTTFAHLGLEVFVFIVAAGILWAGNGRVAPAMNTVKIQHPTPSTFSAFTASLLQLSTSSSGTLTTVRSPSVTSLASIISRINIFTVLEGYFIKALPKIGDLALVWKVAEAEYRVEHALYDLGLPLALHHPLHREQWRNHVDQCSAWLT